MVGVHKLMLENLFAQIIENFIYCKDKGYFCLIFLIIGAFILFFIFQSFMDIFRSKFKSLIMNFSTLELCINILIILLFLYVLCNRFFMSKIGFFFFIILYLLLHFVNIENIFLWLFFSLTYCIILFIVVLKIYHKKKQNKY